MFFILLILNRVIGMGLVMAKINFSNQIIWGLVLSLTKLMYANCALTGKSLSITKSQIHWPRHCKRQMLPLGQKSFLMHDGITE